MLYEVITQGAGLFWGGIEKNNKYYYFCPTQKHTEIMTKVKKYIFKHSG